jgi:TatD DNase family protein
VIDAHAHLTDEGFAADIDQVVERAASAGVARILTCGEDVASSERAVELAERHAIVRAAVGIHPHRAAEHFDVSGRTPKYDEPGLARLRELARHPRVVAIGEIGIDLSGRSAPLVVQQVAFAAQLQIAIELELPVCVHCRDGGCGWVRDLLDDLLPVRGLVHCYSEGPRQVNEWIRRGFFISFAGTVTFPRNDKLRAAAVGVPADRLLLETDAPYLAPQPHRGRRNEPAFVAATYEHVARIREVPARDLADRVGENAAMLFGGRW